MTASLIPSRLLVTASALLVTAALAPTLATAQSGSRAGSLGTFSGAASSFSSHASTASATAEEGSLNGHATLVESLGRRAVHDAEAAIKFEEARHANLQTRLERIEYQTHRQEAREARRQASLAAKRARIESLRMHRAIAQAMAELKANPGARLVLDWPAALSDDRYTALRTEAEGLLALRSQLGPDAGAATDVALTTNLRQIAQLVIADARGRQIDRQQYEAAKHFVRALPRHAHAHDAHLHAAPSDDHQDGHMMLAMSHE